MNGAHQLRNLFSLRTPFAWIVLAGIVASVREWRRVWPLWLWPAATVLFVLTYHPLRDNHLIPVPYSFAVPAGSRSGSRRGGSRAARSSRSARPRRAHAHGRSTAGSSRSAWRPPSCSRRLGAAAAPRRPRPRPGGSRDPRRRRAPGELTSPGDLVVADQPIVAVLAHRQVPPDLVDTAKSRFLSGSLTDADVLRAIDGDPRVTAAVAGRAFSDRPELLAALRKRFAHETAFDSVVVLYGRRGDLSAGQRHGRAGRPADPEGDREGRGSEPGHDRLRSEPADPGPGEHALLGPPRERRIRPAVDEHRELAPDVPAVAVPGARRGRPRERDRRRGGDGRSASTPVTSGLQANAGARPTARNGSIGTRNLGPGESPP